MNVLLTCAGRRHYLARYFREALAGRGAIYTADCRPEAPAMQEADVAFRLPPIDHPSYQDQLLDLCRRRQVGLLIPLHDCELPMIAAWRPLLLEAGTVPVIASPETINVCADKWQTYQVLAAQGVATPRTCRSLEEAAAALAQGDLRYPLVVKPRWGSASKWVESCAEERELELTYELIRRRVTRWFQATGREEDPADCVLIQECLHGTEYGLDVVNDLAGRHVCTFAKRKLAMRAGETDRAVTVQDERLAELGQKLGQVFAHVGNLDCDVFLDDRGPFIVDLNPRFGGGYPFSHVAGANLPAALLSWAMGTPLDPRWLTVAPGIVSAKCDQLIVQESPPVSSNCVEAAAGSEEKPR